MQQAAEKRCTNPLTFSTQRRLTLQNTCSNGFAFRKHSHPDTNDESRGAEQKVWAPTPCMCVPVHIYSLGSFSSKHHYVPLITLIHLSRVRIMYSSLCIRSQGHSLSESLNMYWLLQSGIFLRSHMRVCKGWLCVCKITRLGQSVYAGKHVHAHFGGQYNTYFIPLYSSSKL